MISGHLIKELMLLPSASIREAASVIQSQEIKFAIVCDSDGKLLGTVTDGDIRRSILGDLSPDTPVEMIMNQNPRVTRQHENRVEIRAQMRDAVIRHLPEVDHAGRVVGIFSLDGPEDVAPLSNPVVLMAGGRGERLLPLTKSIPKPLMDIGGKPVLERVIDSLIGQGFKRFYIALHYLGQLIEEYFGDGSRLGIEINYLYEEKPLGTVGALAGFESSGYPLIVMNADLLTRANVRAMVDLCQQDVAAVVGGREYAYTVPYGCLTVKNGRVQSVDEKPTRYHFISAGIYVFAPETVEFLTPGKKIDMPDFVRKLIASRLDIRYHHITEEWIDIGSKEDLAWAQQIYSSEKSGD